MGFQDKLNDNITSTTQKWWESLTKDELLAYLAAQPQITADYLRTMLSNEGICIQVGFTFNCSAKTTEITM